MKRYQSNKDIGLTKEQVELRKKENLINTNEQPRTKTIKEIILSNTFTYFNLLNIGLAIAVIFASLLNKDIGEGFKNSLFLGIMFINAIISIVEEIISKNILERLSLLAESSIEVIRDGEVEELTIEEIVLDDVIKMKSGHQVLADSIIIEGEVEVNESFLTGEADAIPKKEGDMLLSGSFLISGNCIARVEHIGKENYASKMSLEARYMEKKKSIIMSSFESLLKIISISILPIAFILYFSQLHATNGEITTAVFTTVAALIGMIPEGLFLLTSSVMAVSIIRLSKYKVLVQQLYCIDTLARANVICLDKTGTLTEGKMQVVDYKPLGSTSKKELKKLISLFAYHTEDDNSTIMAIKNYFEKPIEAIVKNKIAFSSERKFSAIQFENFGNIYLGAPEVLLSEDNDLIKYQEQYRVLVLGKSKIFTKNPTKIEPLGIILIEDVIRTSAKETIEYFKEQGIEVKIISGDDANTVLRIAQKLGMRKLKGINLGKEETELENKVLQYDIFGRVSPYQKKQIIEILQKQNKCVAMTGDGVNDVLALKQSDCAISLASAADAAKNVSQLILLNDNFDALPQVVLEGRRIINNMERSASLLLVKTIYTILLILFSVIISTKYFFIPIQLTLITTFTIGTPSFLLALEPNHDLVKGNFLINIISRSLPVSLTVVFNVILVTLIGTIFHIDSQLQNTISIFLTATTGFIYLYKICFPFTTLRKILFTTLLIGFISSIIFLPEFFHLSVIPFPYYFLLLVLIILSIIVYKLLNQKIENKIKELGKTKFIA